MIVAGQVFKSSEEVRQAVKDYAERRKFKAVSNGIDKKKRRWVFRCNRGFKYKSQAKKRMTTKTIMTNCKSKITFYERQEDIWWLCRIIEEHNHPLDQCPKPTVVTEDLKNLDVQSLTGSELHAVATEAQAKGKEISVREESTAVKTAKPAVRHCKRCRQTGHNVRTCTSEACK